MTLEFKQNSLKCIEWSIQVPSVDSTLLSEKFKIRGRECRFEFHIKFILIWKIACFSFKSDGKLDSPVTATLRVTSKCTTSSLETHTITDEDQEIWKHKGTASLEPVMTFEVIFHDDPPNEQQSEALTINRPSQKSSDSKNSNHLEVLSEDFSKLLDESSSCDVEISCDGKSFKAHKIILGTRSTVFSAMLKSNMVEGKTGMIKVQDFKASIFQCFLRYLYSGTLPELSFDSAMEFYEISDKYAVEELKRDSSDFLINNLTEDTVCDVTV